jgi:tetratricopeptide (TPR) repeat protein
MDATTTSGVFYHLAQGQIYSMRRNIEYALTEFEIASEINVQIDCVFINLGLTYRKLAGHLRSLNLMEKAAEMTQESLAALNRAVEINPDNAGAWSALAMTYLKMGTTHYEDADRCVTRALGELSESLHDAAQV